MQENMIKIVKELRTETAHRLINYRGRCAHLHGHSWLWRIGLVMPHPGRMLPDEYSGMLADYADLKAFANSVIDPFDHALLLHQDDPLTKIYHEGGLTATDGTPARVHRFHFNPTSENLALWVQMKLTERLHNLELKCATGPASITVECFETASSQCVVT